MFFNLHFTVSQITYRKNSTSLQPFKSHTFLVHLIRKCYLYTSASREHTFFLSNNWAEGSVEGVKIFIQETKHAHIHATFLRVTFLIRTDFHLTAFKPGAKDLTLQSCLLWFCGQLAAKSHGDNNPPLC